MATITIKQNDTKITFKDTPTIDGVAMLPSDLVGCTVKFVLKNQTDLTMPVIKQPATINPDGTFTYSPAPSDVATPGDFKQEWELTFPTGKELTFPNKSYNWVQIISELG